MGKIVIDTNIIVSALISRSGSYSRKIIEKVFDNLIIPLMGEALFNEYTEVTNRHDIFKLCVLNKKERLEFLQAFMKCCLWCKIYYNWRPNLQDEGDNHIIELAVAGGANYIVTKNIKDLKSGELLFKKLQIKTPDEFIKEKLWEQSQ
ncbi:MAG: putative toxin-antitoxin system toxin component, PIN family [Deltaproteobacteria bacterium]|jgi:putative PIN family toxin of toxin-antitoxin system|nr:putative toxin-antitoxin system toxin component, PIN family [Deltaproteobacteria bacterium]